MSSLPRRQLTIVSNRGPVVHEAIDGERTTTRGSGGLVSALRGLFGTHDVTWVACALTAEDRLVVHERDGQAETEYDAAGNPFRLRLATPDPHDFDLAYNTIANPLLWFIQHGLHDIGLSAIVNEETRAAWAAYRRYNAALASEAALECDADAVLVHDYQLYLMPAMLRELGVATPILHFTHIPWPGPDDWRLLPIDLRTELLQGLLGADIIGFQTAHDVANFLATCEADLPDCTVLPAGQTVRVQHERSERDVLIRAYPISIDAAELRAHLDLPAVKAASARLAQSRPERMILRVDRTDPSKNIVRGFHALDRLLARRPDLLGHVGMVALLTPSRLGVPEYATYLATIRQTVADINERHARDGWFPITLRVGDNFPEVVAAYQQYDVLLVNAIADGMNLIAKEGPLVNAVDGVVVLSCRAGAFEELEPFVLAIDPLDVEETAAQLEQALDLPAAERATRAAGLRGFIEQHDVARWISLQLHDLEALPGARR